MNKFEELEQQTLEENKRLLEINDAKREQVKENFFKYAFKRLSCPKLPKDVHSVHEVDQENYLNLEPFDKTAPEKRVVIYTCITGGYDHLTEPVFQKDNVDYVAFTDSESATSKTWNIRKIPEKLLGNNNSYINRYIKLHPHEFFAEYDYAIYIDGNVKVVTDITTLLSLINPKYGLATFRHCIRDCAYEEAKVCVFLNKGNKKQIKKQISRFEKEGFPHHFGLFECTLLFVKIGKESQAIFEAWWNELDGSQSGRDQLALPYCIWKLGIKHEEIAVLGTNVWLSKKFTVYSHQK